MARLFKIPLLLFCLGALSAFTSSPVSFPSLAVFPDATPATLHGLLTRPDGEGKFPAVVLLPACGGMSQPITHTWPEFFAGLGYVTLSVDSTGSRGLRNCAPVLHDRTLRRSVAGDAHGALSFLAHTGFVDPGRVAVMGFSFGAIMITYISARDIRTPEGLTFRAAVNFYGHCSLRKPEDPVYRGSPRYPWLIVNGGNERPVMIDSCRKLQDKPGVTVKVIDGAFHAWDNPAFRTMRPDGAGNPMLYSASATATSEQLVRSFLADQFAK